jgi:hypothetical protein
MRSLHSVELVDVAPVMDPAYRDTSAMARNISGAVESLARWVDADPNEVRSMMEAGQAIKFFKNTRTQSVPKVDKDAAEARACDDLAVALRRSPWTAFEERVANLVNEDGTVTDLDGTPEDVETPTVTDMLDEDGKLTVGDGPAEDVTDEADAEVDDLALARAFLEEFEGRGEPDMDV